VTAGDVSVWQLALRGVLFYLAAYGLTNIAVFGVLSLLPGRGDEPGTSAETFEEIAGLGRSHVGLGLAMSVSCFSLIGIPLTVGFVGKVLLIQPALQANLVSLVVLLVINSAVSAVYYLRIVATLFLRPASTAQESSAAGPFPMPILGAIACSTAGVLVLGVVAPAIEHMILRATTATQIEIAAPATAVTSTVATAMK